MIDIQREKDEMDAIEAKEAEAFNKRMEAQGYEKCKVCEHWCEDLTNGICDSCIDDILDTVTLDDVIEYASTLEERDELALYTQYLYNTRHAIHILKEEAMHTEMIGFNNFKREIKSYIDNDIGRYLDYLEEKGAL